MTTMVLPAVVFLLLSQVLRFNCAVAPSLSEKTNIFNNEIGKNEKVQFDPVDGETKEQATKATSKVFTNLETSTLSPVTGILTTEYPPSFYATALTDGGSSAKPDHRIWRIFHSSYSRYPFNWTYETVHPSESSNKTVLPVYTNYFVVKIAAGIYEAKRLITNLGYDYVRQIFPGDDYYLVLHRSVCSRCRHSATSEIERLEREKQIVWVRQQTSRPYQLRKIPFSETDACYDNLQEDSPGNTGGEPLTSRSEVEKEMDFNDPYYYRQWYLHRKHFHHINVQKVWNAGYSGRGVCVSVLDDGVHPDNPDLGENYDPSISYDFVHFRESDESNMEQRSHGTSCAGIIAAIANNSLCGVGIAYKARVGGCRVLDGPMTDAQQAMALVHALDKVDIYSASWGPRDNGKSRGRPRLLTRMAFIKGITKGRNGKGSIYVWASGNGGKYFDNCNLDGYASSIYTVAIGALTANGQSAYYSESCSATLSSTYIGGSHYAPTRQTLSAIKRMLKVVVPGDHGDCRQNFQGTSAAAPMAAGIIALLLQANPDLTWRDVQHVIVKSSRIPTTSEEGWLMNAAGYHYNIKAGFGVMDCGRMIEMAQNWVLVRPQRVWTTATRERKFIFGGEVTDVPLLVDTFSIPDNQLIDTLEHVVATLSIRHSRRRHLEIYLTSPSNTVSQLLSLRPLDTSTRGFRKWGFTSVHFWGEDPHGEWTLQIRDVSPEGGGYNFIYYFSLTLYGTFSSDRRIRNNAGRVLDKMAVRSIERIERMLSRSVRVRNVSYVAMGTNEPENYSD